MDSLTPNSRIPPIHIHPRSSRSGSSSQASSSQASSSQASSSRSGRLVQSENGDYIINNHLQYCATIFLQAETQLKALSDGVKTELLKIKSDGGFIKSNLSGPHHNLVRLKNQDRDLRAILESINYLSNLFGIISNRSSQRII